MHFAKRNGENVRGTDRGCAYPVADARVGTPAKKGKGRLAGFPCKIFALTQRRAEREAANGRLVSKGHAFESGYWRLSMMLPKRAWPGEPSF
jgi:hypothetical protein